MILKTKWLIGPNAQVFKDCFLEVKGKRIVEIGHIKPFQRDMGIGPGPVTIGLINCHCHLWLSHASHLTKKGEDFLSWTKEVIKYKDALTREETFQAIREGLEQGLIAGTYALLDIEPPYLKGDSTYTFLSEGLRFPFCRPKRLGFLELIGKSPASVVQRFLEIGGRGISLHGAHTVPVDVIPDVLTTLEGKKVPITIHVAESQVELDFLMNGKGPWAELLQSRGYDTDLWGPFGEGPVQRLNRAGLLGPKTILVHCHYTDERDLDLIREKGAFVCICPRSSFNLHGIKLDTTTLLRKGIPVCLGTDSLASAESLCLWDDMRFLLLNDSHLSPHDVFKMATTNGAKALNIRYYQLLGGEISDFFYVDVDVECKDIIESLIFGAKPSRIKWLGEIYAI